MSKHAVFSKHKNVKFTCNLPIPDEEAKVYIERGLDKYGATLFKIDAEVDDCDIKLWYHTWRPTLHTNVIVYDICDEYVKDFEKFIRAKKDK